MASTELTMAIREGLRAAADPERAAGQQQYMRSALPFLGVRVPQARTVTAQAVRGVGDVDLLRRTSLALWHEASYREERYAATALCRARPLRSRLDMVAVHEEFIRDGAWWDHTDDLAPRVGETLIAHPEVIRPLLQQWSRDEDPWIRRCSIIAQLHRKEATDLDLLAEVIEANASEGEFFIRKAIGWALRDLSKANPAWVRIFLETHELSPLSVREASKYL